MGDSFCPRSSNMSSLPVVDPFIRAKLVLRVYFDNLLSLFGEDFLGQTA